MKFNRRYTIRSLLVTLIVVAVWGSSLRLTRAARYRGNVAAATDSPRKAVSDSAILRSGLFDGGPLALDQGSRDLLLVLVGENCESCSATLLSIGAALDAGPGVKPKVLVAVRARDEALDEALKPLSDRRDLDVDIRNIANLERFRAVSGISTMPTSMLLDTNHNVRALWTGLLTSDQARRMLDVADSGTSGYQGLVFFGAGGGGKRFVRELSSPTRATGGQ